MANINMLSCFTVLCSTNWPEQHICRRLIGLLIPINTNDSVISLPGAAGFKGLKTSILKPKNANEQTVFIPLVYNVNILILLGEINLFSVPWKLHPAIRSLCAKGKSHDIISNQAALVQMSQIRATRPATPTNTARTITHFNFCFHVLEWSRTKIQ